MTTEELALHAARVRYGHASGRCGFLRGASRHPLMSDARRAAAREALPRAEAGLTAADEALARAEAAHAAAAQPTNRN